MNIAIIAHEYLPTAGGSIEVIKGLSQAFKSKSHKLIIVAFTMRRRFKRFEIIEGIAVYRLGCPFTIMPRPGLSGIVDIIKLLLSLPLIIIQFRRIIRKNKTQIINVHFVGINALCTWILSYFARLRYIVSLHGFNVQVLPFLSGLRFFVTNCFYKAILTKATFLTACS